MKTDQDNACVDNVAFGFLDSCSAADFLAFESEWIFWFSVTSAAAFAVLSIPRILHLSRGRSIVRAPALLFAAKLIAGALFTGLRLGLLILAVRQSSHRTPRLIASTALQLAASCFLLVLSSLEHFRSSRPSILACLFLFLGLICDITRSPFLWSGPRQDHDDGDHTAFAGLFTASIVVEFGLLVLESARRGRWVAWNAADHSPEETSSILSLGLYSWLNRLLWRGYREPLTMQHLFALDRAMSVTTIEARIVTDSPGEPAQESTKTSTWALILWLAKPLGRSALMPIFPRLCLIGFTFCQPFFLERLLLFLSSDDDNSTTASGLVTVAILTYFGIAISTALYWYYQERFQSLLRAFLISAIYRKTADIRHVSDGDNAAVTLMGTDVERIYTGVRLMHEVWANAIQIALAAWLLQRQIGLAFLAPLVVVLFGFACSFALSRRAVPYQSAWMARVQARIGVTSSVLSQIKDLRVSGMTNPAATLVQEEREDELRVGERSRILTATSASLSQLPQAIAPALAFAFGPHVLDETVAYTALSFLTLLTAPLLVVLQSLPILAASVACLRRIKLFLIQDGRVDERLLPQSENNNEKAEKSEPDAGASIEVRNGHFGWAAEKTSLREVNLCLPTSSITFVVGPVASGKSTLCRALLGEIPYVQGSVALKSDKLGYCDQIPFLFNASIRENIVGFSSFDSARYASVIQATILVEDLKDLPAGDETTVGPKGVSLSGGQRQRVSLARALYHSADICILDDVFSGLDGTTQDLVCRAVFGADGLLRRRRTTAIVCTHSTQLLSLADHIVILSSEGIIEEQRSFAEIVRHEGLARRLGLTDGAGQVVMSSEPADITDGIVIQAANLTMEATTSRPTASAPVQKAEPPAPSTPVSLQTVDIAVYRHWLSTIGFLPVVPFLVLVIGLGFCTNFPTIWLKLWSEDSVSPAPQHSFSYWVGIYTLIGAGAVLCVFPASLIVLRTTVRLAGTNLHHAAINTVMHSSLRFLTTTDVGKVLNLFSQDMNIMDTQLPRMVNNLSFCLATAIGQAVVIAVSSPWLAVSYPFFVVLLWAIQVIYLPSSKRLRILDLEAKTPLYTNFLDTLAGLPTIRAFGWFPHQLARNNALLDDSQRPSYLLAMAQQWLTLTMNILVALVAVMLVSLATQLGSSAGNAGAGMITLITLGGTLTSIIVAYTGLETSLGAINRLKSFEEETEMEESLDKVAMPEESWPATGNVQMRNVEASYDGTGIVLKGLTLSVEAGQKLAICGRTGSGKSSILSLLLRLINPIASNPAVMGQSTAPSSIVIDGVSLDAVDRTTLRERIISASQDPVFLPSGTSFRANLDPWNAASDAECLTTLQDLGLAPVIEAKGGLEAPVNGSELSAGQKQLLSLARAVLRRRVKLRRTNVDGGLLLLDEITSSADAYTEQRVRTTLEEDFGAYTVIMVTHRREMAVACDRAIVIDAGRVVEDGNPRELLDRERSWFKALYSSGNL